MNSNNTSSTTDIYIISIPKTDIGKVYPEERQVQLDRTTNIQLRRQRYFVWKLLEYALEHSLGYKLKELTLRKNDSGKWSCNECFFSLSHTEGAAAVAISTNPVGIDIEPLHKARDRQFAKRILTDEEYRHYSLLTGSEASEYIINKWCAKESLFKQGNDKIFKPSQLDCSKNVITNTIVLEDIRYCCAVASEDTDKLRIYKDISL